MFPIMMDEREWKELNNLDDPFKLPKEVPMDFVKQFHSRILKTHSQTPEELKRRGGLHPTELCAAIYDQNFFTYWGHKKITDEKTTFAINMITMKLNDYNKEKLNES
jgi:hypothetical protein